MFKFKMLTKVLVAVFFYGQIIELNLNLCIAHSIGLASPEHRVGGVEKAWQLRADSSPDKFAIQGAIDDQRGVAVAAGPGAGPTAKSASAPLPTNDHDEAENQKPEGDLHQQVALAANQANEEPRPDLVQLEQLEDELIEAATEAPDHPIRPKLEVPAEQSEKQASTTHETLANSPMQILESNGRLNYFGRILVGERRQPFVVLFDLSSSGLWLPSSACKSESCVMRTKYNASASASHQTDGCPAEEIRHNNGMLLRGQWGRDTVEFAGVQLEAQHFFEVEEIERGDHLKFMPVDGFLGLGFNMPTTERGSSSDGGGGPDTRMSPVERLWAAGKLREPIISIWVDGDVPEYSYSANNGEMLLGELAPNYKHADLTYVPVTRAHSWEFHLSGVTLHQTFGDPEMERGCMAACPATLDTRYDFIAGHHSDVHRLNTAIGGRHVGNGLYRLAECDLTLLPYLTFHIGGAEFALAPEEYVTVTRVRGQVRACYSALVVVDAEQQPAWILGERFLRRHYVVFDYGQRRIGFARSRNNTYEIEEDIYGRLIRKQSGAAELR